jgi:general secretion pathway protein L
MKANDIFNADMATMGRWARDGLNWWLGELSELLPQTWRRPFLRQAPPVVELGRDGLHPRGQDGETAPLPRCAAIVLPPDAVLTRDIELPILPAVDLRRMVGLDIDRLAPLRADTVVFDLDMGERDAEKGRLRATLGVLPRATVDNAVARARAQGVEPVSLGIDGGETLRFDFLRASGAASTGRSGMWWTGAGVLAALNILFLIYRDDASLDSLREAVESQQATVAVAERLRRKVDEEALHRTALMERARHTPLAALAAVTWALPDSAWVQRFEWNPSGVHIAGFQSGSFNTLRALEASPRLRHTRALTATAAAGQPRIQGFDIAADLEAERHP